jgi:glucose-1-phosphate thymidylyltransferase
LDFTVVNDGSTDDSNKLGAIGDMRLVITREQINDDLIVVAGRQSFQREAHRLRRVLPEEESARARGL